MRVRPTADLTRYHPKLCVNALGVKVADRALVPHLEGSHKYSAIMFDFGGRWDILEQSYEWIGDEDEILLPVEAIEELNRKAKERQSGG